MVVELYLKDSDDSVPSGGEIGGGLESSPWQCFEVQTNECFVTINLRIGSWMDSMQVLTSKDRQSEFWGRGSTGGNPWTISADAGECISELYVQIDTNTNPQSFRQIKAGFNSNFTWSPTSVPTKRPTTRPTRHPSDPMINPTSSPTMQPSSIPTKTPSISPTKATMPPSFIPTKTPSIIPTMATEIPSDSPTQMPTVSLTDRPSKSPSNAQTDRPTGLPTVTHTVVAIVTTVSVVRSYDSTFRASQKSQEPMANIMPMFFVYIVAGVCLCLCIFGICVCKTRNRKKKAVFVIDKPAIASPRSDQSQKAVKAPPSGDFGGESEDEEERKEIRQWMAESVKLSKYSDTLISNGFDKMEFILDIRTKEELKAIGISLPGHQVHILSEIAKCKASVKSGEGGIPDKKEISFIVDDSSSDSASAIGGNTTRGTDGDQGNASMDNNGVMAQGDQDVGSRKDSDLLDGELFVDPELIETIC